MKTLRVMVLGITLLGCGPTEAPVVGQSPSARPASTGLTAAQCKFGGNGKVRICHATGSAKHPYAVLQISDAGCQDHAAHPNDYFPAAGDAECHGGGCLPAGTPADAKIPCCPGLVAQDGACTDLCAGVSCAAQDECHSAGTCDPGTGQCSHPVKPDGSACNDGNACSRTDTCQEGVCTSTNPIVCAPVDQCHVAGACDPGSGLCSTPAKPDRTACDDGNASTCGDVCTAGACAGTVVDLQTDPGNCGACGNVCPTVTNGSAACTAGACGVGACNPGFQQSNGQCVPTPTPAPTLPAPADSCRLVNGILWCFDPSACGQGCNDVCSSLGLSLTISDADWFAAQNTPAKCQAISNAFGLGGTALVDDYGYACVEDWGGDHAAPGGLLPPLMCSVNPGCPRLHRTLVDQGGVACGPSSRRAVCPCQ